MSANRRIKDSDASLRKVAPGVLAARFDAMMAHTTGTREGADPEELHAMRVASRRLRAALDAFASCYKGRAFTRVLHETKTLTRALGTVRDDDVLLGTMRTYAEGIPADEQPALAAFIAHLAETRDTHRAALVRHLDALDADGYTDHFHSAVAHPEK